MDLHIEPAEPLPENLFLGREALRNAVGHAYPDPDAITDSLNGIRDSTTTGDCLGAFALLC